MINSYPTRLPNTLRSNAAPQQKLEALDTVVNTVVSRDEYIQSQGDERFNHKRQLNGFSYGSFFLLRRAQRHYVNKSVLSVPPMLAYGAVGLPLLAICTFTPPLYIATTFLWGGLRRDSVTADRIIKVRIKRYLADYLESRQAKMHLDELQQERSIFEQVKASIAQHPWKTSRSIKIHLLMNHWRDAIVRNEKHIREIDGMT